MRKSLTISIPKPCHENWDAMTPEDKGRHCQVCEKTVYDFTKKTDEQIIKTFEKTNNLCGRFKSQQLDREIVLRRKSKNSFASIAASGLFAFLALGTQEVNGQGEPQIVQTETKSHDSVKGKVATSVLKEKVIHGTVIGHDGLPLPRVNIIKKGTSRGVQTDFDGNYAIKASIGETLAFSYVGFMTIEVVIRKSSKIDVVMQEDEEMLTTGIVIMGYAVYEDYEPPYVYTPKELEAKKKKEFRRENNVKFYKRKMVERLDSIRNIRTGRKKARQEKRQNKNKS